MSPPALLELFDHTWPGISRAIDQARGLGWEWWDVTTPFARYEGGRAVAHVGVLETTVLVDGEELPTAVIHAVCTHREHRGHGLSRGLLQEALAHVDGRVDRVYVNTVAPELFRGAGFEAVPETQWFVAVEAERCGKKQPEPVDPELFAWLLPRRAPLSQRLCARDPGWMLGICEVLEAGDLTRVHQLTELEATVVWEEHGRSVDIVDIVCARPLRIEEILPWLPEGTQQVRLLFSPDQVAPNAVARAGSSPDGATFMVRGDWDLGDAPVAMPPLSRC